MTQPIGLFESEKLATPLAPLHDALGHETDFPHEIYDKYDRPKATGHSQLYG